MGGAVVEQDGERLLHGRARGVSEGDWKAEAAKLGRIATHSREAEALRSKTRRRHAAALAAWAPSDLPDWLNEEAYRTKIQPALARLTVPAIAAALGISEPYATDIRRGNRRPHQRHWLALARMVGVLGPVR